MNMALERLARELSLADPAHAGWRLRFGHACAWRIRHLLEDPAVEACLREFGAALDENADPERLRRLAAEAARLANHHPGSRSLDGCGHAAVSASYAVAKALDGRALEAASYAAYAAVYAQGGYAAVADPESFQAEFDWQVRQLAALAGAPRSSAGAVP